MENHEGKQWVQSGWQIATKLLAAVEPDMVPLVSKQPTLVFENRFVLFYAMDPISESDWWIITGEFPPAIVSAADSLDEREALRKFGKLFTQDGSAIRSGNVTQLGLPVFVLDGQENVPEFGEFLEGVGDYLSDMAETFPWQEYGVKGKVFGVS